MESPVMTSASSHRLRSAVSACAQPTHSYLNSAYLGTSLQRESRNSSGCVKKLIGTGRNGEPSPLKVSRNQSDSCGDFSSPYKRHKAHHRPKGKPNGKQVDTLQTSENGVPGLISKQQQLVIGNDLLTKLKLNGLTDYWDAAQKNESVVNNREKVIEGKGSARSSKKSTNNGSFNNGVYGSRPNKGVNHRAGKRKSKKGKTDSCSEESERGDECSNCGVVNVDEATRSKNQQLDTWQQKHVVTRRTAQCVRDIRNAWRCRVGSSSSVPAEEPLNDLPLFASASKVSEMLEFPKECPGKPSTNSRTFGDFCSVNEDILKCNKTYNLTQTPPPIPRILEENVEKCHRKFSKGMSKYEVFLGGSCNPTTWRTDLAIPELEKMGISYYNPQQVEEWRPELMEAEYHAKENATVMFFVIDNQTRGVSALIEVAHLAGNQRKLILVIQSYTQKNQIICDEAISQNEYEDLKTGQETLQDLVESQGIPVFGSIEVALQSTKRILRENLKVQDLQQSVRSSRETSLWNQGFHVMNDISRSPQEVFDKLDSGSSREISVVDACLALKMLTGVQLSMDQLKALLNATGKDLNGTPLEETKFDFAEFVDLVTEFKRQQEKGVFSNVTSVPSCCKDVYLGGTLENTSWREFVAIPMLEPENLSFFIPKICEGGKRFTDIEAAAMESSFILLFVITNTARSIAAMAIAGHYIGKGANVVLCVENLPEEATISGEKLSESAVKDYNRGRMYLRDIAKRSEVPVFDEISKAVKFVIQKCRNR